VNPNNLTNGYKLFIKDASFALCESSSQIIRIFEWHKSYKALMAVCIKLNASFHVPEKKKVALIPSMGQL
jgi:hypothetical protein